MRCLNSRYLIQIMIPEYIDNDLHSFLDGISGITWPSWGSHISLINSFIPKNKKYINKVIKKVCKRTSKFTINLNNRSQEIHIIRPYLNTVLLTLSENDKKNIKDHPIYKLRQNLLKNINSNILLTQTKLSRKKFNPHLSLTWGIPENEATELVNNDRVSKLNLNFKVEKISLIEISSLKNNKKEFNIIDEFNLN